MKSILMSGNHMIFSVQTSTNHEGKILVHLNKTPDSHGITIPYSRVLNQGIYDPSLLQNTECVVDFFEPGEILVNGQRCVHAGKLVKNIIFQQDKELARQVNLQMRMEETKGMREAELQFRSRRYMASANCANVGYSPTEE